MAQRKREVSALQIMDKARKACDPPSWYQLARELKTDSQTIAKWRSRGGAFDNDAAYLMAGLLGITFEQVVAIREASREKNEERKSRWIQRLKKTGASLLTVGISLTPSLYPNGDASATAPRPNSSQSINGSGIPNDEPPRPALYLSTNYATRRLRRLLRQIAHLWRGFALAPQA